MRSQSHIYYSVLFLFLVACAGSPLRTSMEAERNRANLLKLKIGLKKDQVLEIMGQPYKTESYMKDDKNLEFYLLGMIKS